MMKPADLGDRDDLSDISVVGRPLIRRILLERQMRPGAIVVTPVVGKDSAEMPLVENDYVVQTLSAQGANESLRIGVLPR